MHVCITHICVYVYCVCICSPITFFIYPKGKYALNLTKINIFCKPLKEVFVYYLTINIYTIIKKDFSQNTNLKAYGSCLFRKKIQYKANGTLSVLTVIHSNDDYKLTLLRVLS